MNDTQSQDGPRSADTQSADTQSAERSGAKRSGAKRSGAERSDGGVAQVGTVLDGIADEMPQPQPHAIEAEENDQRAKADQARQHANKVDRHGNPFDPDIHVTDENGEPQLNAKGQLRMKPGRGSAKFKGRAEPGSKSSLHTPGASRGRASDGVGVASAQGDPRAAGHLIAENIFALGQAIGGAEWAPLETWQPQVAQQYGINERQQMREAWATYCERKGISDVPPGIMVVMVMGSYAAMRLNMPQTKSRFQRAKSWLYQKLAARKAKKRGTNGRNSSDQSEPEQTSRDAV
jgi:hypothetical protein